LESEKYSVVIEAALGLDCIEHGDAPALGCKLSWEKVEAFGISCHEKDCRDELRFDVTS
jgi:hypothetical protein